MLGIWKSYEEMEDVLSLPELEATVKGIFDREYRQQRFAASLKGIDLEKETGRRSSNTEDEKTITEESPITTANDPLGIGKGLGYQVMR